MKLGRSGLLAIILVTGCSEKTPAKPEEKKPKFEEPAPHPVPGPGDPAMKRTAPAEYKVKFETTHGDFVVAVTRAWAPMGADRFYNLVKNGFYDGCRFFRVLSGYVVQFGLNGDPKVTAAWREAAFPDEAVTKSNEPGMVTFAKTNRPDSRTTQIFINMGENGSKLDDKLFSPFGKVVEGMDVVNTINARYGEKPNQPLIEQEGNDYLRREFPDLDFIKSAKLVE